MRLPPTFPQGVDPTTYRRREIQHQLEQSAFVSVLAVSNRDEPDRSILHPGSRDPRALVGIRVFERPHRFVCRMDHSAARGGFGPSSNTTSTPAADLRLAWTLLPDDYAAYPGCQPPPVLLDPTRSQRFAMLDGQFRVDDEGRHRFRGFGTGRTFPVVVGGEPRLRLGALGNILDGEGAFANVVGSYVINGYIRPMGGVFLHMLFRVMDPSGRLRTSSDLEAPRPVADPDPGATFVTLLGEPDPSRPVEPQLSPDGRFLGARVHELLRSVELDWDRGRSGRDLRTRQRNGPIVGRLSTDLLFDPTDPRRSGSATAPVPFRTRRTQIELLDGAGRTVGTLAPDVVEGRGFQMPLDGAPLPAWRLVGYGPIRGGTGLFEGAEGMLSVNAAISVMPPAFSNVYVLRLLDPGQRLRWSAGR